MRNILCLFLIAFAVAACTSQPAQSPRPSLNPLAKNLESLTVALYAVDHPSSPVCTGVWIAPKKILTAAHCISIGEPMLYSIASEYVGVGVEPLHLRSSELARVDLEHDMAVYETGWDSPPHPSASMAWSRPEIGDNVFVIGHPHGITWSFRRGTVSRYRETKIFGDWEGPWMQVQAPIYFGDSGGGVFNSSGELVGLVHSIAKAVPDTAFMVTQETIRAFIQ